MDQPALQLFFTKFTNFEWINLIKIAHPIDSSENLIDLPEMLRAEACSVIVNLACESAMTSGRGYNTSTSGQDPCSSCKEAIVGWV